VPAQGVTAVIGPNGAGKTTLFNLISGFLPPSSGQIICSRAGHHRPAAGQDRGARAGAHLPARQAVRGSERARQRQGRLPSAGQGGLFSALLRPASARREEAEVESPRPRAPAFHRPCGLADEPASSLPYGRQRMLELARAMAAGPRLILLDEPAAGLNAEESAELSRIIRRIADTGTSVLLIEHDMTLVMNTADRVVVVDFGRKIAQGTPARCAPIRP
jgi:branched-chain amino acid transport system ATP-binding protein